MKSFLVLLAVVVMLSACGKNDGFFPISNRTNPNGFYPQMPGGMPNQYYPFLPIDNYYRQNQMMQAQWQMIWAQWQQYAAMRSYSVYNFMPFWYEFCPQVLPQPVYNYFDSSFYVSVDVNSSVGYADPYQYWAPYAGTSYYGY